MVLGLYFMGSVHREHHKIYLRFISRLNDEVFTWTARILFNDEKCILFDSVVKILLVIFFAQKTKVTCLRTPKPSGDLRTSRRRNVYNEHHKAVKMRVVKHPMKKSYSKLLFCVF